MEDLIPSDLEPSEWELDKSWDEVILNLPDTFQDLECSIHNSPEECKQDHTLDDVIESICS